MRSLLLSLVLAACDGGGEPEKPAAPAPAPAPEPAKAEPTPDPVTPEPTAASAQPAPPDMLATSAGEVQIRPLYHGTLAFDHGGKTWVVDPWSKAPLEGLKADVVLLTDLHPDHLDPAAIEKVRKEGTIVVGPAAVADKTKLDVTIANGESKDVAGLKVTAVPMYNLQRGPEPGKLFHDKGRGNGYLVDIGDARLYIAGDTECTDEMKALTDVDVAFIPMNLPYTMPPEEAVACIQAFKPRVVYPYHYNDSDLAVLDAQLPAGGGVEVRKREWYPGGKPQ